MKWSTQSPLRVALLDDHPLIRNGFAARMAQEGDLDMVALYASSRELMAQLKTLIVDVLVLDYSLQQDELDGLNLIRLVRIRYPKVRILVSSATESPAIISMSLRAGARGFIGKSRDMDELLGAIRRVALDEIYLDPVTARQLVLLPMVEEGAAVDVPPADQGLTNHPRLSPREQEVLRCCLEGLSVSQIAFKFSRSIKTISAQKQAAFRKLGIRSNIELFKVDDALGKS